MKILSAKNLKPILFNLRIKLLDSLSPFASWIAVFIYHKHWLSEISINSIRELKPKSVGLAKVNDWIYSLHLPENRWKSVIAALLMVFVPQIVGTLWFISPYMTQVEFKDAQMIYYKEILSSMWQVSAGLIGITFVIVIFIVEYSNRDKYERRALPVFFAETKLLFSTSLGIFIIFSMGISLFLSVFPRIRLDHLLFIIYFQWFLFFVNLLNILLLFIRTIGILPRAKFMEKLRKYNYRLAAKSVELEIVNRISHKISNKFFSELGIDFPFFEPDPNPGKVIVSLQNTSKHFQTVDDINLGLVALAHRNAKLLSPTITSSDFIFYAKLDYSVAKEKPGVAIINPVLNRPCVTNYLQRSIRTSGFSKNARANLNDQLVFNRDMILKAIQNREGDTVEDLLNQYYDLVEGFLEITNSLGIHFTQKSSHQEFNLIFNWKLISTIVDQYQSLIHSVIILNDFELIGQFLLFPTNLMRLAMSYKDHLIYQQFVNLYRFVYYECQELIETNQRERIISRFVNFLIGHRKYDLSPRLEKNNFNVEQLSEIKDYYKDLIFAWNHLLKLAIDQNSTDNFSKFSHEVKELVDKFHSGISETDILLLKLRLDELTDGNHKVGLSKEYEYTKFVIEYKAELRMLRQRMYLGLGGWLIHLLETKRISIENYLYYISSVDTLYTDLAQLYEDYSYDLGEDREEHLFNWTSWELSEKKEYDDDETFHQMNFDNFIDTYFIVRSIEIVPYGANPLPPIIPTFKSKDIYEMSVRIFQIINDATQLQDILKMAGVKDVEERISALTKIFLEAKIQLQISEEEELMGAQLEQEQITLFKNGVLKSWENYSTIRSLFQRMGRYREIFYNAKDQSIMPFGPQNKLIPKGIFVHQNRVNYAGWGDSSGHKMAELENSFLGAQLISETPIKSSPENLLETLKCQLYIVEEFNNSPIIFIRGDEVARILRQCDEFIPAWRIQKNPLGEIPVFGQIYGFWILQNNGIPKESISIVDISNFGILTQYIYTERGATPINIEIRPILPEQANHIINKNPDWLKSETGENLDQESSIRRVLQNVNLRIEEYCRFEEINPKAISTIELILD